MKRKTIKKTTRVKKRAVVRRSTATVQAAGRRRRKKGPGTGAARARIVRQSQPEDTGERGTTGPASL